LKFCIFTERLSVILKLLPQRVKARELKFCIQTPDINAKKVTIQIFEYLSSSYEIGLKIAKILLMIAKFRPLSLIAPTILKLES